MTSRRTLLKTGLALAGTIILPKQGLTEVYDGCIVLDGKHLIADEQIRIDCQGLKFKMTNCFVAVGKKFSGGISVWDAHPHQSDCAISIVNCPYSVVSNCHFDYLAHAEPPIRHDWMFESLDFGRTTV